MLLRPYYLLFNSRHLFLFSILTTTNIVLSGKTKDAAKGWPILWLSWSKIKRLSIRQTSTFTLYEYRAAFPATTTNRYIKTEITPP